ncbi:MAG: substrate-binding and VWA domain-containing protein [Angustibacter sp.]
MSEPSTSTGAHRVSQRGATRWLLVLFVLLPVLLVVFLVGKFTGASEATACTGAPVQLVVASSVDKSALLTQMAADFSRRDPVSVGTDPRNRCVQVTVVPKASGAAQKALAAGWKDSDGPRPDVWSPTSSVWLPRLENQLAADQKSSLVAEPDNSPAIATSVEVVAMPRPMAQALGWPSRQIGWRDLLQLAQSKDGWAKYGHPEWGRFVLGKTNPLNAHPGLAATVATYYAASGKTSNLTVADVQDARNRRFVAGVEQSILRYGDTSGAFLSAWQRADQQDRALSYLSALVTQESLVLSYNQGYASGDPSQSTPGPKPRVPLVALYPRDGTFIADHPYAVLSGDWVTADKRAAARAFLDYLRRPEVQQRFLDSNFRTFERAPGPGIKPEAGALPDQPARVLEHPEPRVVDAVLASWNQLRKTANVLSLVDVSGSMAERLPGSPTTRLAAAQAAAISSLDLFTDQDEVGLWSFSGGRRGVQDYQELVPIGPMSQALDGQPRRQALAVALKGLRARGDTGLYNSTAAAYQAVLDRYRDDRINAVVVLTDGRNDAQSGLSLEDVLDLVGKQSGGRSARIITIAYGPDADQEALAKIAAASRGASYVAATPEDIPKVYASALSNF